MSQGQPGGAHAGGNTPVRVASTSAELAGNGAASTPYGNCEKLLWSTCRNGTSVHSYDLWNRDHNKDTILMQCLLLCIRRQHLCSAGLSKVAAFQAKPSLSPVLVGRVLFHFAAPALMPPCTARPRLSLLRFAQCQK